MPTITTSEPLDLSVDFEVFSTPNAGVQEELSAPPQEVAWLTFGTTCWSCKWTCGCDSSCAC